MLATLFFLWDWGTVAGDGWCWPNWLAGGDDDWKHLAISVRALSHSLLLRCKISLLLFLSPCSSFLSPSSKDQQTPLAEKSRLLLVSDLYPQQKKRNPFSLTFFSVFPPSSLLDVQRLFSWQWLSRSLQQAGRHLRIFLNTLITHTAIVSIRRPHSFFPSFLMELPLRVVSDFPCRKSLSLISFTQCASFFSAFPFFSLYTGKLRTSLLYVLLIISGCGPCGRWLRHHYWRAPTGLHDLRAAPSLLHTLHCLIGEVLSFLSYLRLVVHYRNFLFRCLFDQ